VTNVNLY